MKDNTYQKISNQAMAQLREIITASRADLLNNESFNQYVNYFCGIAGNIIPMLSAPAIRIKSGDTVHYMVAGEKFKILYAGMFYDKTTIKFTNPFDMCIDEIVITSDEARRAMDAYMVIYDIGIERVMAMNEMLNILHTSSSNGEKLEKLSQVIDLMEVLVKEQNTYYEGIDSSAS